ncbi:MAG TPA: acyl-CoA dehydrogenase family protein [Flavobacteriaceae bacterium]|nr:acyl-CoA dehydrogenase family protein [Flavobacteriaceae bacterium]
MGQEQSIILRGGEFLIKETSSEDIFTPEDFSEEQRLMRDSVREFVDREIWPKKAEFEQKNYALTKELMQKAAGLGYLGISVPEEYGGLGMGFVSSMLVCDYISGATGSFSTAFGAHTGIGTLPISLYGTEEQKKKYLPKLAAGEWFGCYCLTEPGAGSDANSGKTKAVISADRKHYHISGQKMWISNAGFCDLMIVFARIENDKNISAFIVEYDPENRISLGEEEKKLGIHSSSTRQVFFNETKVPVENMLSERNHGFKIAMNALNVGRIKLGAACLDAQRRNLKIAANYAQERVQFGKPIAEFGAIQSKIAEMATSAYVGESACYRTAKMIEDQIAFLHKNERSLSEAELNSYEEFAIESSLLKVAISEDLQHCTDEGIQIFGGLGFSKETPMESAWRDARITRIYEGTNEINRILAVGMLIKRAAKGQLDIFSAAEKLAQELTEIPSVDRSNDTALFSEEKKIVRNLKKVFLMIVGSAVKKFGVQLEEEQQVLLATADILIEIYLSESTLLRTEKNSKRYGRETQKTEIAMSQLYLFHAVELIQQKAKECIVSISSSDEQRMLLLGLKRFTNYQNFPNAFGLRKIIAESFLKRTQNS